MNPTLLKDLILAGHRVACKTTDGNRKVFLFINGNGRFQGTTIQDSIDKTIALGLYSEQYTEDNMKAFFTGEYKIVTPLPQLPQVGDTVEVLEICRELPGFDEWVEEKKNMVGKKFKVERINYYGTISLFNGWYFSSRQVAKCEPEDAQSIQSEEQFGDTIVVNGKTYKAI